MPEPDLKGGHLPNTCMSFRHRSTMATPASFDIESILDSPFDTSFDLEMHQDNVEALRLASLKYL